MTCRSAWRCALLAHQRGCGRITGPLSGSRWHIAAMTDVSPEPLCNTRCLHSTACRGFAASSEVSREASASQVHAYRLTDSFLDPQRPVLIPSCCMPAGRRGAARALGLPAHPCRRGCLPGHLAAGPPAVEAGADRAAHDWAQGAVWGIARCMTIHARRCSRAGRAQKLTQRAVPAQADPAPVQQAGPREYTRVVAAGQLQHERSILIGPRPRSVLGTTQPG